MSLRARATAFCVWSFHSLLMRKVPHKNVKYLFLSLIISIFASCKTNDNLLWKDL